VQARAKQSLTKALEEHRDRKGKGRCQDDSGWYCLIDECLGTYCASDQAFIDHLRRVHHYPASKIEEKEEREDIKRKERKGKGEDMKRKERKGKERLNDSAVETHTRNSKRCFDEEERINDDSQGLFSENDPGPSKRVKMA
jgi:hypothetical protein